jgi:hypothetical protein
VWWLPPHQRSCPIGCDRRLSHALLHMLANGSRCGLPCWVDTAFVFIRNQSCILPYLLIPEYWVVDCLKIFVVVACPTRYQWHYLWSSSIYGRHLFRLIPPILSVIVVALARNLSPCLLPPQLTKGVQASACWHVWVALSSAGSCRYIGIIIFISTIIIRELVIMCYCVPLLMLWTCTSLHGFDHVNPRWQNELFFTWASFQLILHSRYLQWHRYDVKGGCYLLVFGFKVLL